MKEETCMELALELALKGCGRVNPNPLAGAVVVKDGRIIGRGYHAVFGGLHAERDALASCTESPEGADLYVTLEPCCHHGKQPPCTDAILESRIRRVFVGSADPNPLVRGRGVALLRARGVEVIEGVLRERCDEINRPFFHYIQTGLPYVILKYAMTLDGKTASFTGASRWITGEEARRRVHEDRNRFAAILVGSGTVLTDDPLLTCRIPGGRNPLRVICDTSLRTPLQSQIAATACRIPTLLATGCGDAQRQKPYLDLGFEVAALPKRDGQVDLKALMRLLGGRGIDSVLMEGGAALGWSAVKSGIVNRVQAYISPRLLGGQTAPTPVGGQGFSCPDEALRLAAPTIRRLGRDLLLESEVV